MERRTNGRIFPRRGRRESIPVERRRTGENSRGEKKNGRVFPWRDRVGEGGGSVTGGYSHGKVERESIPVDRRG